MIWGAEEIFKMNLFFPENPFHIKKLSSTRPLKISSFFPESASQNLFFPGKGPPIFFSISSNPTPRLLMVVPLADILATLWQDGCNSFDICPDGQTYEPEFLHGGQISRSSLLKCWGFNRHYSSIVKLKDEKGIFYDLYLLWMAESKGPAFLLTPDLFKMAQLLVCRENSVCQSAHC